MGDALNLVAEPVAGKRVAIVGAFVLRAAPAAAAADLTTVEAETMQFSGSGEIAEGTAEDGSRLARTAQRRLDRIGVGDPRGNALPATRTSRPERPRLDALRADRVPGDAARRGRERREQEGPADRQPAVPENFPWQLVQVVDPSVG